MFWRNCPIFQLVGDDEETIDRRGDVCKKGELEIQFIPCNAFNHLDAIQTSEREKTFDFHCTMVSAIFVSFVYTMHARSRGTLQASDGMN